MYVTKIIQTDEVLHIFKGVRNNDFWYYKLEADITGSGENIDTKIEILRSYQNVMLN